MLWDIARTCVSGFLEISTLDLHLLANIHYYSPPTPFSSLHSTWYLTLNFLFYFLIGGCIFHVHRVVHWRPHVDMGYTRCNVRSRVFRLSLDWRHTFWLFDWNCRDNSRERIHFRFCTCAWAPREHFVRLKHVAWTLLQSYVVYGCTFLLWNRVCTNQFLLVSIKAEEILKNFEIYHIWLYVEAGCRVQFRHESATVDVGSSFEHEYDAT